VSRVSQDACLDVLFDPSRAKEEGHDPRCMTLTIVDSPVIGSPPAFEGRGFVLLIT
jgi:hypothetical protein